MRVLLLSMPDSFEHTPALAMRMPNGALASLAGNAGDPHHRVAIADLILAQDHVRQTVERLVRELEPDVVGLSVMTFQRQTALRIVALVRAIRPGASSSSAATTRASRRRRTRRQRRGIDFVVRGEGEIDVPRAAPARSIAARDSASIAGLSFSDGRRARSRAPRLGRSSRSRRRHRAARPRRRACSTATRCSAATSTSSRRRAAAPSTAASARSSRCAGATSTPSRFERVIADIGDARARGARAIFLVDDNITLDVARFEALCHAIVAAGLNDVDYIVQAMTSSIASHGDELAPLMRRRDFATCSSASRTSLDDDLAFLNARGQERRREGGRAVGNATRHALSRRCIRHGMFVVGGLIVGNPDDTPRVDRGEPRVRAPLRGLALHPAPDAVSGTPMTARLRRAGPHRQRPPSRSTTARPPWSRNDAPRRGRDRVHAVEGRALDEAPPPAGRAAPRPALRAAAAPEMCAHTFRGCTWRSMLGLESSRDVFARYKQIRASERDYFRETALPPNEPVPSFAGSRLNHHSVRE